jgi:membrane protein YqaA with SNARE-associated domain
VTKSVTMILGAGWAASAFHVLKRMGAFGVFLLGIADSSFLFFPFGNDLLLISLVASQRDSAVWILYVVMAALGSVLGVLLVDVVMRKVGEEGLEHFVKPTTIERLKKRLEGHAGWFVFGGTLVPPPFPFTAIVMTASALQIERKTLLVAVFFGRLLRFTIDALLALAFGRQILRWLESDVVQYCVYGLIVIAIVGSVLSIRKWTKGRRDWRGRDASREPVEVN